MIIPLFVQHLVYATIKEYIKAHDYRSFVLEIHQ